MDASVAKGRGEMECGATDARGPFELRQCRGLLAGRQDAGVSIALRDSQAVGRRVRRRAADAPCRQYCLHSLFLRRRYTSPN